MTLVLRARLRQISFEQAELLSDIHELAHAPYTPAGSAPAAGAHPVAHGRELDLTQRRLLQRHHRQR